MAEIIINPHERHKAENALRDHQESLSFAFDEVDLDVTLNHAADLIEEAASPSIDRWVADPVLWVDERLHGEVWSRQAEILRSVRDNPNTAVPTCHTIGKSFSAALTACWWLDAHPPGEAFVVTCYTDDTEILTKRGWLLIKDVVVGPDGDEFATRNQWTHEFEWQHGTRFYREPWDGEVIDFHSRSVHLRVTPNHRMLGRWTGTTWIDGQHVYQEGEHLKRADTITHRGIDVPMTSTWKGASPGVVHFGRYEWSSLDFAAFLGAWLAEGSLGPPRKHRDAIRPRARRELTGTINITQLPGTKGFEPYRELLTRMLGREPCLSSGKNFVFACADLYRWLQPLGKASGKHIPAEVKDWGRDELQILLYYYLLGDGHYQQPNERGNGAWKAWTTSSRLADDLQEVAQKLGGSASITPRAPRGGGVIDGRKIEGRRICYQICFNRSKTKVLRPTSTEYVGDVVCVSVPNEVIYVRRPGSTPIWCGNTAPTGAQVKAILWRYIGRLHEKHGLPGRTNLTEWYIGSELVALGRKPSEYSPDAFQGIHATYMLVIIDEACGVVDTLWDAASTLTSNELSRQLAIGNPDNPVSRFQRVCQPGSGWNVIQIGAADTPAWTGEPVSEYLRQNLISQRWAEQKAIEWGTDSPLYQSKVLGQFPLDAEDGVVPVSFAMQCRYLADDDRLSGDDAHGGIDVGESSDRTVIYERRGMRAGRVRIIRHSGDAMTTVGDLVRVINDWGLSTVTIDVIGIGWGVYSRLKELSSVDNPTDKSTLHSAHVCRFSASEQSTDPTRFINRRAELWWDVGRELSRTQSWDLSSCSDDVIAELTAPKYRIEGSRSRIQIESKDDIRVRLGRSPDLADALLMAFYVGDPPIPQASFSAQNFDLASTVLTSGMRTLVR